MCTTCGCSSHHHHSEHEESAKPKERVPQGEHEGQPSQTWSHDHQVSNARIVQIERDILSKNAEFAARNRKALREARALSLNLISSPGSGKTTLLVKTIELLKNKTEIIVIEGDQQTSRDADRIRATGIKAQQINTGKGCHLDAHGIEHALEDLSIPKNGIVFIENVGNLVCPAEFDLGENAKVVILSVTEGEDKPIKYPNIFANASLMIINKTDLLPHLDFNTDECVAFAKRVNPKIEVLQLSARSGHGMDAWVKWIAKKQENLG